LFCAAPSNSPPPASLVPSPESRVPSPDSPYFNLSIPSAFITYFS
jgi:hypothetical protein